MATTRPYSFQALSKRLTVAYGVPDFGWPNEDPVDTLVGVILSQNTSDSLSLPALLRLKKRFPNWNDILDAPLYAIKKEIQTAGLANIKALRIRSVLREVAKRPGGDGTIRLDFLRDLDDHAAREYLLSLKGVGPKSAAIVLQFSFERALFPVDTHIYRVMGRLGYWNAGEKGANRGPVVNREQAHEVADRVVPDAFKGSLHVQLIAHGRAVCKAQRPACGQCPLFDGCLWKRKTQFA